jgi:hypothetical protein
LHCKFHPLSTTHNTEQCIWRGKQHLQNKVIKNAILANNLGH